MELPVVVVDIIGSVVADTDAALKEDPQSYLSTAGKTLNYIYGDREEINKVMQDLNQSITLRTTKYPLVALIMPFPEELGEYNRVNIGRLIFATATGQSELFSTRYTQYFKPILYPIYFKFFEMLARYTVEGGDPNQIYRRKMDVPRIVPSATDGIVNDFVDAIVVMNLNFFINPIKTC